MNRRLMVAVVVVLGVVVAGCGKARVTPIATPKASAVETTAPACQPSLTAMCLKDGSMLSLGQPLDRHKFDKCQKINSATDACSASDQNGPLGNITVYGHGTIGAISAFDAGEEPKELGYFPKLHFGESLADAEVEYPKATQIDINGNPVLLVTQGQTNAYYAFNVCRGPNVRATHDQLPSSQLAAVVIDSHDVAMQAFGYTKCD